MQAQREEARHREALVGEVARVGQAGRQRGRRLEVRHRSTMRVDSPGGYCRTRPLRFRLRRMYWQRPPLWFRLRQVYGHCLPLRSAGPSGGCWLRLSGSSGGYCSGGTSRSVSSAMSSHGTAWTWSAWAIR
ncbi:hypothetical protein GCM10009827_033980 [Dactylosporangium maewongense]|uniref:Uncharacterized protein n=1 Tax=Dactylosporangium maewongense TaxID=634393 RepID=A0ABP4L826_9ACTN